MKTPFMLSCLLLALATASAAPERPRLLVLTDLGQDPDDHQSLIRLLVHADRFDIEGLVLTADNNHSHEDPVLRPDIMADTLDAYAAVLPNLRRHRAGFPEADALRAVVRNGSAAAGNPVPPEACIGEGFDTPGSDWIAERLLADDPRPLNIAVWGGAVDLAQAVYRLSKRLEADALRRVLAGARVHAIALQDQTNAWLMEHHPELEMISSWHPAGKSLHSVFRGMFIGGDLSTLSRDWIADHLHGHGPLGDLYPTRTWTGGDHNNPHGAIKEGDTPSFLFFFPNGLNAPDHPDYGGWGGRFQKSGPRWTDAVDTVGDDTSGRATVYRWRTAFQNEFQARMDWCVLPPGEANHPPVVALDGGGGPGPVHRWVRAGETLLLDARPSFDPDGDRLVFHWWHYPEPSSFDGAVAIPQPGNPIQRLTFPEAAIGHTLHLVLEVTDTGSPALTRYQRVVVGVK